jgi:hypothetical protein
MQRAITKHDTKRKFSVSACWKGLRYLPYIPRHFAADFPGNILGLKNGKADLAKVCFIPKLQ